MCALQVLRYYGVGMPALRLKIVANSIKRSILSLYCVCRKRGETCSARKKLLLCLVPLGVGALLCVCLCAFAEGALVTIGCILILGLTAAYAAFAVAAFVMGPRLDKAVLTLQMLREQHEELRKKLRHERALRSLPPLPTQTDEHVRPPFRVRFGWNREGLGDRCIEGTMENGSEHEFTRVRLTFSLFDAAGGKLDLLEARGEELKPYGTWDFSVAVEDDAAMEARVEEIFAV